jgi:glycosyltransferase involved in cell wall biosynthesis
MLDISIIIPAFNEKESLPELLLQVEETLLIPELSYEILVVDDGSNDGTMAVLRSLKEQLKALKVISFRKNYGKSAALAVGFSKAKGKYVITMDSDLQDDPAEIPKLVNKLKEGYDLVSGWKKQRRDPLNKKIPSKIFNFITSRLAGIRIHDINCGLKAYRLEVVKDLEIYGELHRFLPVLAHWNGYYVGEMVVNHHPRKYGKSKFGLSRFFNGFFDLMTVLFITRYKTTPLHIFGFFGLFTFLFGVFIELYLSFGWIMGEKIRGRPLFFLGILSIIVGVQFIFFGLLGEMLSSHMAERVKYSIKEIIE